MYDKPEVSLTLAAAAQDNCQPTVAPPTTTASTLVHGQHTSKQDAERCDEHANLLG
jgi:hypothetical protein